MAVVPVVVNFVRSLISLFNKLSAKKNRLGTLTWLLIVGFSATSFAFTTDPYNPGNPMNQFNPMSPWCSTCSRSSSDDYTPPSPEEIARREKRQADIKVCTDEHPLAVVKDQAIQLTLTNVSEVILSNRWDNLLEMSYQYTDESSYRASRFSDKLKMNKSKSVHHYVSSYINRVCHRKVDGKAEVDYLSISIVGFLRAPWTLTYNDYETEVYTFDVEDLLQGSLSWNDDVTSVVVELVEMEL